MKKNFIPILLSLLLIGCKSFSHIEDINGDDTKIATITEEEKIKRSVQLRFIYFISTSTPAAVLISVSYPPERPVGYVLCRDHRQYKTPHHIPEVGGSDSPSALQIAH